MSLDQLNRMPDDAKAKAYRDILPPRAFEHLGHVDPRTYGRHGEAPDAFRLTAKPGTGEAHLRVPAQRRGGDYAVSLDLTDLGGAQLELSFIVINDLTAPRVHIDVDPEGRLTLLGTAGRNIEEEKIALLAGLGPCQVRRGLGLFAEMMPRLEAFAQRLGHVAIQLEPLTYHNAVMYENYGFAYTLGRKRMARINEAFKPGGVLRGALDGSSVFRDPEFADSARGRSWAIHDGVLEALDGEPHLELHMVKVIGRDAGQHTFSLE